MTFVRCTSFRPNEIRFEWAANVKRISFPLRDELMLELSIDGIADEELKKVLGLEQALSTAFCFAEKYANMI